jgi:hypothetical protein
MTVTFPAFTALDGPFPGLRAFEAEEALLFYGREVHVAELLDRLGDNRFVAVTGTSGSGKSSLVRAGLRPALHRGYLLDATSRWRFATMRPGSRPIDALAESLSPALGGTVEEIARPLRATSAGLADVVNRAGLAPGESLLLIADQFEELFRFDLTRDQQANATLFVSLLLEATEQRQAPIYVVVTMRSEFLGRCSEFTGLAEAFNRSQYLVPRLTRDERREAIERPLRLFGTSPSPALVQQVLNDVGDDPDQLPVMQHVLLRTYREWVRAGGTGRLDREHYEAVGGIEHALNQHGDEILDSLSGAAQKTAEKLFRSLTVAEGGVALRRPRRMRELYEIAGANDTAARKRLDEIVTSFAHRDSSFLMLSSRTLTDETVVDITHESLIRKWKRLEAWVRDETRSVEWYVDLTRDVARYRTHEVSLWQDPELECATRRRDDEGWNEAWANQYRSSDDPTFPEVLSFLDESTRTQEARRREEEDQRSRELRQAQDLARAKRREAVVMGVLLVGALVAAIVLYRSAETARNARTAAESAQADATESRQAAEKLASDLGQLNALLEQERKLATSATASAEERAQLEKEIAAIRAQATGSQAELARLRQQEEASASASGGLQQRIDTLQQQLDAAAAERGRLQAQLAPLQKQAAQLDAASERASTLQSQLEDERARFATQAGEMAKLRQEIAALRTAGPVPTPTPAPTPTPGGGTAADVTRAFTEGVRAYDLGNWKGSAQYMQDAVRLQSGVKELPREVRMSGTRFVPYAPYSYLAVALLQLNAECSSITSALAQAAREEVPPDLKGRLQAAQTRCGSSAP